jgi:putative transposase
MRVGVDVGVRVLATVASPDGVIERVPNPRPLEAAPKQLRHLSRERSRRTRGSRRYTQTQQKITRLHRRVTGIRGHHLHVLTTRLAKTHGEIVAEGLDAAAMPRQKGPARCPGPQAWPVRLRPGRDPPPAGLQDRLVRLPPDRRGPVIPVLEDLPRLRQGAGYRLGRALDLHRMRGRAPARR